VGNVAKLLWIFLTPYLSPVLIVPIELLIRCILCHRLVIKG